METLFLCLGLTLFSACVSLLSFSLCSEGYRYENSHMNRGGWLFDAVEVLLFKVKVAYGAPGKNVKGIGESEITHTCIQYVPGPFPPRRQERQCQCI